MVAMEHQNIVRYAGEINENMKIVKCRRKSAKEEGNGGISKMAHQSETSYKGVYGSRKHVAASAAYRNRSVTKV